MDTRAKKGEKLSEEELEALRYKRSQEESMKLGHGFR